MAKGFYNPNFRIVKKKILITGATGLIGTELSTQCLKAGLAVNYLTTSKNKIEKTDHYNGYYWNPEKREIDLAAFEGVSAIVNLVGATIAKRWTNKYKKEIIDSRVQSMHLLYDKLKNVDHDITHFISASGVDIYPPSKTKLYTEESEEVDSGFLGKVVVEWEEAANKFKSLAMEVTKVRTGMVLAREGGAFPQLLKPIRLGVGAPLGSGEQWYSWIHIKDIAGIYLFILQHQLEGEYNAVAPNPVQNKKLTKLIASEIESPLWLPPIPDTFLDLVVGEMSTLITDGQLVSSKKIQELGYHFQFYNIDAALQDLLH